MKVAVITRHAVTNYGSLLQAFATQQVIERLGHTCQIIDYIRRDESCLQREKTSLKRKPEWNHNVIKRMVYLTLRQPESLASEKKFETERSKYLNRSRRYRSLEQLSADKPIADIYMTGSDQVWGPVGNGSYDSTYCLSFTDVRDKRVAYAASFGRADMVPGEKEYFKKWLSRYDCISVREDSAVEILNEMGVSAVQVLDPTLLLDAGFWLQFTSPVREKEYVLAYQLHNDKRLGTYALRVAKEMGLPLIRVSASFHQISREGKLVWCPAADEFLSYIRHAACLITDSFHGTVFAISFHTPFVEILPNNNTGTRSRSILKMINLSDRILEDDKDTALAQRKLDFLSADQILADNRKQSLQILSQMLEY